MRLPTMCVSLDFFRYSFVATYIVVAEKIHTSECASNPDLVLLAVRLLPTARMIVSLEFQIEFTRSTQEAGSSCFSYCTFPEQQKMRETRTVKVKSGRFSL